MVRKDKVQVEVEVDGKQGINALGKLEMEAKDLRATLKDLKKGTEEYNLANEKLKTATASISALRQEMGLAGMTLKQLTSYQRDLNLQWQNLTRGTEEWKRIDTQLKEVNGTIDKQRSELKGTAGVWGFLKTEIGKFGALAVAALGFDALVGKLNNMISRAATLSDAMADLRMTTGLSAEAADQYNKALGTLGARTSREDLLGIGKIAGQFGVAKDELLDFTKAMNMTSVVLSSEFSGGATEITEKMATLRNVFSDIKTDNISDDITKISNAVVTLAQEGVASAPVVTDFSNRIAGIGIPLGLSSAQVLGLSATMQELGITAERGGTAVGKILQKMTTNTDEFAKVAGMDLKSFSNLVNTDIYGAFLKVLDGSKKSGEAATTLGKLIKDLEISGAGASEVFNKLGGNMDLLQNRTKLAGDAIKSTSAITEQYNLKNETFAANLEKVQKVIANGFISNNAVDLLKKFVGFLAEFTEIKVSETLSKEQIELNRLVLAINDANDKYGVRSSLIKELQEKYPAFLGNLDAEKVSNEELKLRLADVNAEYTKKIFLAKKSEDWQRIIEQEIKATQGLIDANKSLSDLNTRQNQTTFVTGQIIGAKSAIKGFEAELDNIRAKKAEFEKEQSALAKAMGINLNEPGATADPVKKVEGVVPAGDPEADKKRQKELEDQRKANEKAWEEEEAHLRRIKESVDAHNAELLLKLEDKKTAELLKIDQKYDEEILKVGARQQEMLANDDLTFQQKKTLTAAYEAEIDMLEQQREEAKYQKRQGWADAELKQKQDLQAEIDLLLMTEQEREVEAALKKYETLIEAAKQYGLDYTGLYQAMLDHVASIQQNSNRKELQEEKKQAKAKLQAQNLLADSLGELGQTLMAGMSDDMEFQRILTIAGIAIDTAAAISKTSAMSAANPANATTFGAAGAIQFATGLVRILAVAAQARNTANVSVPDAPTKYFGGETGSGNGNKLWQDQYGPIVAGVHPDEYVVPSFVRHEPAVINATSVIEAYRQNAISSGKTSGFSDPVSTAGSGSEMGQGQDVKPYFEMVMKAIVAQGNRPVVFVKQDYERFEKDDQAITYSAQK
jgi:TP901 family phage tail tape measure protein